jgi:hypothetical protein
VQEVVAVEQVNPPGEKVTVYAVIALPPLDAGAVQLTTDDALPTVPETLVGAPGTVLGITFDDVPALEFPAALIAITEKV